jgi:hypothetical protein
MEMEYNGTPDNEIKQLKNTKNVYPNVFLYISLWLEEFIATPKVYSTL